METMSKLTQAENVTLMSALRCKFDNSNSSKKECEEILAIAIKCELPSFFIAELISDLKTI